MALHHGHATSIEGLRCDTILGMKEPHQYFVILNRSEGSSPTFRGADPSLRLRMTILSTHRQWL